MGLLKYALKLAVKTPRIEEADSFLFIAPHPDDIEIGAGATVAKLAKMNKKITFLVCTDGRFGDGYSNGVEGDALAELRMKEAKKSSKILGVKDIRFLNLTDGGDYSYSDLLNGIAKTISDVKPDMVFAPDPFARSECHEDHINVGNAVRTICCLAPYKNLMLSRFGVEGAPVKALALYMTARPNRFVNVKGLLGRQFKALFGCHISQYPAGAPETDSLKLYLKLRYLQYAGHEGFRVYSQTQMHCLPEAD